MHRYSVINTEKGKIGRSTLCTSVFHGCCCL